MDGRQLAAESAGCRCSGGRRRSCSPAPSERRNPSASEEGGRDVFNDADSVQGATSGGLGRHISSRSAVGQEAKTVASVCQKVSSVAHVVASCGGWGIVDEVGGRVD